jgi:leucine efflux protein
VFIGDAVLMVLAAAGVASLLKAYPALFMALKYAGGAYLIYLGAKLMFAAWKGRVATPAEPDAVPAQLPATEGDPLRRALGVSLVNPKAILFFIAFFIQFVDPGYAHKALSFAILGGIAQSFSFLYLSSLIFSGARLAAAFRRWRRTRTVLTGGAGVKLATASVG